MNNQTFSSYTKIIFSSSLCISLHIFASETTQKDYNALDWRSKCVPVKSSQLVPSNHSLSFQSSELIASKHSLNYQNTLITAVRLNDAQVLIHLIQESHRNPECNIDLNAPYNENKETLLHLAANLQYPIVMKILLKNDALPNAQDIKGFTPLHIAIMAQNMSLVHLLLDYDANATIKNKNGYCPDNYIEWHPYGASRTDEVEMKKNQFSVDSHPILLCARLKTLQSTCTSII